VPIFVEIAPGGNPESDGSDWVWTEITADVRNRDGIVITDGRGDEGNLVDAKDIRFTLNNGASRVPATLGQIGCYSPRNPAGPYWGKLRKNMPVRVGIRSADDEFDRTVASGWGSADWGGDWGVTGTASNASVSGGVASRTFPTENTAQLHWVSGGGGTDTDSTMKVATPNTVTGASLVIGIAARIPADQSSNYYIGWLEFTSSGGLGVKIRRFHNTAGNTDLAVLNPIPSVTYTPGTYVNVRFQADGAKLRLKVWKEADPEPDAWTISAEDTWITAGGDTGIYMWRVNGNTNATGPHFRVKSFHTKSVEAVANVTELPVRWDITARDSWAPVRAAGVLRRLTQGPKSLNSPLFNQSRKQPGMVGLWMLEDGPTATELAAADPYNGPAELEGGYTLGSDTSLPGAKTTLRLTDGFSRARGTFARRNGGTGFSFMFFVRCDSPPTQEHEIVKIVTGGFGGVGYVRLRIAPGGVMYAYGYGGTDNAVIFSQGVSTDLTWADWTAVQMETETVGSTVNWSIILHKVGASTGFGAFGGSVAASGPSVRSTLSSWQLTGNGEAGISFSTIYGGTNALPFVDSGFALVSNGYQGETAGARLVRVFAEAGIPFSLERAVSTVKMGYQPQGDALTVARDCEKADGGILYERGVGLAYRPRYNRYNRPVELSLDLAQGHFEDAWDPTDDDRYEANDVTITRTNGGSARSVDEARIALVGRYEKPDTINVFKDADLPAQASWRRALGTVDTPRWPRFRFNFRRNFDLTKAWRYRTFGARMQAVNEPVQIKGTKPDVIIEGYTQTLRTDEWTVEVNTSPAEGYAVGVYGSSRYDAIGSVLVANKAGGSGGTYSTNTPTFYVNTPGVQWSTTPGYTLDIGGEEVTVTSVFSSGADQGINVTRAVNGVAKTHVAGEEVHIADARRFAL